MNDGYPFSRWQDVQQDVWFYSFMARRTARNVVLIKRVIHGKTYDKMYDFKGLSWLDI